MAKPLWELKVDNVGLTNKTAIATAIVDGNGNQITSFGGSGGTSAVDEAAFTVGSGTGTPVMGIFESSPTTLSNGQAGLIGLTNDRKVKVSGSFSSAPITSATSTIASVSDSASSVTVLASNASRLAFSLYNDSTAACYVKCGATASATSFVKKMLPGELFTTAMLGVNWTGIIDAIWVTAPGGSMRVTELSA